MRSLDCKNCFRFVNRRLVDMVLKAVIRKRLRISNKTINLDYFVSKASILNKQRKASQIMVEEGELIL